MEDEQEERQGEGDDVDNEDEDEDEVEGAGTANVCTGAFRACIRNTSTRHGGDAGADPFLSREPPYNAYMHSESVVTVT